MEDILYACYDCRKKLGNIVGLEATNEVGRKNCYGCGGNDDNLMTFGATGLKNKVDDYNKGIMKKPKEEPKFNGASFTITNCEDGCDNCGVVGEFGIKYKPKHNSEKTLDLCQKCSLGIVICFHNAGMLE